MPVFFKIWFAFVAIIALSVFGAVFYLGFTIISDPAIIGRTAGKIVSGYEETQK